MDNKSHLGWFAEGFITLLIFLVLFETLAEEYAAFMSFSARHRKELMIAGFCFDLLFSVEFLLRFIVAGRRGGIHGYMTREGGFIDFVSSFPLLILASGPLMWITFFSGRAGVIAVLGGLSLLKTVKVIRVVRALRILRAVKLFKKKGAPSDLTSFFVSRVASLSIGVIVIVLIGFSFVNRGSYNVALSDAEAERIGAFVNLIALCAAIGILLAAVTFYKVSFKRHVSEVLRVMIRGFKTADYSVAARIDENKAGFETYTLADQYNRKWLPLKRKILEAKKRRRGSA